MIVNIRVKCSVCRKITTLKIGYRDEKPHRFSYSCKNCNNIIEGIYNFGNKIKIIDSLHHAEVTDADISEAEYYQPIDSHFPVWEGTDNFLDSLKSPFLASAAAVDIEEFKWKNYLIEKNQEILFDKVININRFYFSGNKKNFEKETEHVICIKSKADLVKGLAQLNEILIEPMLDIKQYSHNLETLENLFLNAFKKNETNTLSLVEYLEVSNSFFDLQRDIFEINEKLITNISLFNQRLLLIYARNRNAANPQSSTNEIISNTDFDSLKQIYLESFETLSRSLVYLMGLTNIDLRNDFNNVSIQIKNNVKKLDLIGYTKLPSAKKRDAFKNTLLDSLIIAMMDSNLRNGIGHKSARFDKEKKEVIYYMQNKETRLPYFMFIDKAYNLWVLLNSLNSFIAKSMLVLEYSKQRRNLGIENVEFEVIENKPIIKVNIFWHDLNYSLKDKEYEIFVKFWNSEYFLKHYNLMKQFIVRDDKGQVTIEYANPEYNPTVIDNQSIKEWYDKSNKLTNIGWMQGGLFPYEVPYFRMALLQRPIGEDKGVKDS